MYRFASPAPLLISVAVFAAALSAETGVSAAPRISPAVRAALRAGVTGPLAPGVLRATPGRVPVIIELSSDAREADLDALQHAGAGLRNVRGRALRYRRFVPARIDAASLERVAQLPSVRRISPAPRRSLPPMDVSARLIGLAAARGSRPALDLLTGTGIVVADLDTDADIYHPQFFRADAGYYDWIDVNRNGVFDPGTDAIDLDRNGKADPGETAQPIIAETLETFYGTPLPARDSSFDPSMDWLYLDQNDNGVRDYGAKDGFDDTTPAFGEPLFVPDDVNVNGKLDVGERVARLGTSKFSKVYVHVEYYADVDHVFARGTDLSSLATDYTGGAMGYSDSLHASGVLSIVAGDVVLPGRRWVGIAPDADLLLGFEIAQDTSASLTWALGEKPDVMLHETAGWTGFPLDGSDAYSVMVDESMANDGVTHTCPDGNVGGAHKHVNMTMAAGSQTSIAITVPDMGAGALSYAEVSLNFRGGVAGGVTLREPGGKVYDITGGPAYQTLSNGAALYISRELTDRATDFVDIVLYTAPDKASTQPVPVGDWQLELGGDAHNDLTLDGYVADNVSGWEEGVAWPHDIATDDRTIGIPAVSDHCIAVGAHTGHPWSSDEPWYYMTEGPGEIRAYSGRGPRIDGSQKPDLAAPDNPWSAAPSGLGIAGGDEVPEGAMWPMGGTSGATPHVTGVAALLAQASIRGDDARDAIRSGAVADATTGAVPNTSYGWGRLNAAGALGVPSDGVPPTLVLEVAPNPSLRGTSVTITPEASDPDGEQTKLELKWDDGYDGTWDSAYGPVGVREVTHADAGRYPYKARVRDAQGRIADAVAWVAVVDELPLQDAGADGAAGAPADGGNASSAAVPDDLKVGGGCGCSAAGRSDAKGVGVLCSLAALALVSARLRRPRPSRR